MRKQECKNRHGAGNHVEKRKEDTQKKRTNEPSQESHNLKSKNDKTVRT